MQYYTLKLDKIYGFRNTFIFSNAGILERDTYEIEPVKDRRTKINCWHLSYPHTFLGITNFPIDVPTYKTMTISIDPILTKNGINVNIPHSIGSWCRDKVEFLLQNNLGPSIIEAGVEIGTIFFF